MLLAVVITYHFMEFRPEPMCRALVLGFLWLASRNSQWNPMHSAYIMILAYFICILCIIILLTLLDLYPF